MLGLVSDSGLEFQDSGAGRFEFAGLRNPEGENKLSLCALSLCALSLSLSPSPSPSPLPRSLPPPLLLTLRLRLLLLSLSLSRSLSLYVFVHLLFVCLLEVSNWAWLRKGLGRPRQHELATWRPLNRLGLLCLFLVLRLNFLAS